MVRPCLFLVTKSRAGCRNGVSAVLGENDIPIKFESSFNPLHCGIEILAVFRKIKLLLF